MPVIHEGPPPSHRCEPPTHVNVTTAFGNRYTRLPEGSIFECPGCGRGAVVVPFDSDVNVWHRRSRRWLNRRKRKLGLQ